MIGKIYIKATTRSNSRDHQEASASNRMKLRWINLTFQPRLYVLSLTIALAVCSIDGRNDSDFIGNFNHTPLAIYRDFATERWNANETDGTDRQSATGEMMYYKNNTLNRDTNESSSTASVTPAIANVNTDTTRSITLGYQELENRNSTIGFNGSTTRTPVSTSIPQSVYNQTSSFTKTASTTRVAGSRSSLHKGNSSTKPWLPQRSSTVAGTLLFSNSTRNRHEATASLPLSLHTIEISTQKYGNKLNRTKPDYRNTTKYPEISSTAVFDSSNYSSLLLNKTPQKLWGFPFHNATSETFNSSQTTTSPAAATTTTTLSSLWLNTGRPSAQEFHTSTPLQHQFSSKFERQEPWKRPDTPPAHGQNHFNSIVNVKVDSSAETLEKMIRLEATISKKMNEMQKMAEMLAGDLKLRLNRLEEVIQLRSTETRRAIADVREVKQHLESLIDIKSQTLETKLKEFKCAHQHADNAQTTNEPIKSAIVELRNLPTTQEPPKLEGRHLDSNKDGLADWRAKRAKLMERWESNFQRGFSRQRKSTKRSTRNLS
ncbi:uncharacterized protein LOC116933267 isoform X2 [Daphnia magna]|uniref:uncharacterized protein LOC116933267 isoform X2 n=1 Tax=Daphnia magna TaxID=35525 RepID=UPI001E1BAE45|nr:uncharacterized protein LOC116933267 isoform X2 [Daphnia magna]